MVRLLTSEAKQLHVQREYTTPIGTPQYDGAACRAARMADAFQSFDVLRIEAGARLAVRDHVATERALEVRLDGEPFSVIMRTPGDDADLAIGFLFTEGIVRSRDDVRQVEPGESADVVNVRLARGRADIVAQLLEQRRQVVTNASCGTCGRRSLATLAVEGPPLPIEWQVPHEIVAALPDRLRGAQHTFDETGGLHAAGLFDGDGRLDSSAEDIGRHNAVDKLIGRMVVSRRLPLRRALLSVSGRSSFEIVQKAFAGGIPLVAAVSAPSSLAVDLARSTGITLVGFVRGGRFNCYAHPDRIR